ncbi:MAG TPA: histidine phosphatase family protein [Terriglobales bacterium]|nr:histidine phosphatase family protein [Terriglobales bacterium]
MSRIYLVRHGQAGTRDDYDSLSRRGREQSRFLGEYLAAQNISFVAAYTGAMLRQQQTAEELSRGYTQAGGQFPAIVVDKDWNEFDLSGVYRELAPLLSAADPDFRREYAALCEQARQNAASADAPVHREWLPCDTKLVDAWIAGRSPFAGESWERFVARIAGCRRNLQSASDQDNIIVFTSAVPVAIWAGLSLDIYDQRVMRLAAVLYNTSYTILRLQQEQLRLFGFNAIPHLLTPDLRTHR